jgi:hypothetical protein
MGIKLNTKKLKLISFYVLDLMPITLIRVGAFPRTLATFVCLTVYFMWRFSVLLSNNGVPPQT